MLLKNVKRSLKGELKNIGVAWKRRRHSFSAKDLMEQLVIIGVRPGDLLLVHSSFDQFVGFEGKATDVNAMLQQAVGPSGALLMPTMPFRGSAVEYVSRARIFDVRTTPSQMGLLTELFRRAPGVLRSVHPTHPVAVWGDRAGELIANHHNAQTPCGRNSPYHRFLESKGKILFLGTDISVMTFFHYMEDELETAMPFSPFTREVFSLLSRDSHGNELVTRTRLYDPEYSQRRNLEKLIPVLNANGAWQENRIGILKVAVIGAAEVAAACREMAQREVYCYDA